MRSVRGAGGGYRLSREPSEYTAGDILRVAEGSLAPVACLEDSVNQCPRASECPDAGILGRFIGCGESICGQHNAGGFSPSGRGQS